MTTYKGINGFGIQYLDSDPANPNIGEVWYNNTSKALKGTTAGGATSGTWASGGNLPVARQQNFGFGTQNACLTAGGEGPGYGYNNATLLYNGSSWSISPATLNTGRNSGAGFGVQTAGIVTGGYDATVTRNETESWDGSAWTEVANLATARANLTGFGTQTAGLITGGSPQQSQTETWNGSAWSEVAELNTARTGLASSSNSPQTSGLVFGGGSPTSVAVTESWDGTSWTEVADLNTARQSLMGTGSSSSSALAFGGTSSPAGLTESWNGSSWSEVADLGTPRREAQKGSGTADVAICVGGNALPATAATEEWTTAATVTKTFTVS